MKHKLTYIPPAIDIIDVKMESHFMEWSNQTIDGQDTPDFDYGGEAGEGIEADSKRFMHWDSWDDVNDYSY